MSEKVIELSVEETNSLRASLGLKPLNTNSNAKTSSTSAASPAEPDTKISTESSKEELNLSVQESNALRIKLGLKPLKTASDSASASASASSGRKASEAIHAPAQNTREQDEITERLEKAKLKREVEAGIAKLKSESEPASGAEGGGGVLSWADQMRKKSNTTDTSSSASTSKATSTSKNNKNKKTKKEDDDASKKYTDSDFQNQNITVAHAMSDFDAGSTQILTLADTSILDVEQDNAHTLENVNLSETAVVKDNLKRKRMMEMGIGHAGGYTGYDDDEFEELGGSQMTLGIPSKKGGGKGGGDPGGKDDTKKKGFKLGSNMNTKESEKATKQESDLFAGMHGQSISLETGTGTGKDENMHMNHQADFMSLEEEEAMGLGLGRPNISSLSKEKMEKRRKKKEKKLRKKLKKDKKKGRKEDTKNKDDSAAATDDNDDDDDDDAPFNGLKKESKNSLLQNLISASKDQKSHQRRRKRRRDIDSDDSDAEGEGESGMFKLMKDDDSRNMTDVRVSEKDKDEDEVMLQKRKDKFQIIMEKGNERTRKIFSEKPNTNQAKSETKEIDQDESKGVDDDAYLSAALSKAKRLRRLKEMNAKSNNGKSIPKPGSADGAEAVVAALRSVKSSTANYQLGVNDAPLKGRITFELGTTSEFTRALRAQPDATKRNGEIKTEKIVDETKDVSVPAHSEDATETAKEAIVEDVSIEETIQDNNAKNESLEDLADQVKEEKDDLGALGSTGSSVGVGRGLSAFLGMLKQTGEIAGKSGRGGREELRGRAKDEKTYEDYAPLDLKKVVKLDTTGLRGTPHDKDVEFANREVKLEYRDEHGRLLTRKEAYRQLCYQFHGHGSSKRKEEKRQQQVEREQTERSANSRSSSGTLGLQKATQKATGKAFVVRRT